MFKYFFIIVGNQYYYLVSRSIYLLCFTWTKYVCQMTQDI